jgi:regulator of protease activity HflC (stomatin/prohibitin superfamily)
MEIIIPLLIGFAFLAIKIAKEYERAIIFRLGRFVGVKGPGLFFLIPIIDKMEKVDLRIVTQDVPPQEVITKDNVPVKVDAVVYYKIVDPEKAIIEVEDYRKATSEVSQTTLRGVAGASELDEILAEREKINDKLHQVIDKSTDPWGIEVTSVEVKHVEVPREMQRSIAQQAEAERTKRSKIILADGEYQAAEKLKQAGEVLGASPITLRYLETLSDAAKEENTSILFPIEVMDMFRKLNKDND